VSAHFLLAFCPCGHYDVYLYPATVHEIKSCYPGENHIVDADEFLAIIRLLVKKALVLAVLTSGFQTESKYAR